MTIVAKKAALEARKRFLTNEIHFDGDVLSYVSFDDHMWRTNSCVPCLHSCKHNLRVRINAFTRMLTTGIGDGRPCPAISRAVGEAPMPNAAPGSACVTCVPSSKLR
jgi:hypothetical protein